MHGFTDYSRRNAHLAKKFADDGFDFYSMDYRGHGESDGKTVLIPSIETIALDNFEFHQEVVK